MLQWAIKKFIGTKHEREIKRYQPMVAAINDLEPQMKKLSDDQLRAKTAEFKTKIENGATVDELLIPAFAACREGAWRSLGMRHYDVQLIGGATLNAGKIAEMKTGEGKTLVATLACYLNALEGKGVHVVTVNDYLATRDAEWMGKLYGFMGLSTGVVVPQQGNAEKKRAYRCDITYGQNNEFGFDYLRDNMKFSIYDYAQRPLHYAIVDEVDSILVDEARTPLIISGPGETASEHYTTISDMVPKLRKDEHYTVDEENRSVTLTEEGIVRAQKMLLDSGLTKVENLYEPVNLETLHILQQCLRAHTLYIRDKNYLVTPDGKVVIIDDNTGRTLPGRRWSEGLHQAVEAKEHVHIQDESRTLATISFQNLFRLYNKLSGMTGTADTEAAEFHKIYKLDVTVIPTNKPIARVDDDDLVYKTEKEKFKAIANEIKACREGGQPVLVGTTSVEKSEAISRLLDRENIEHNVLNAKQHEREAYVVAQAGRKGAVTIATNMAGRGTDIVLGGNAEMIARFETLQNADEETRNDPDALQAAIDEATKKYEAQCEQEKKEVLEAGGMHILGTERHESRRIDNQLRGRAGRQGDPGTSRFYLSLQDDLMRIFAGERVEKMMDMLGMEEDVPIEHKMVTRAVENAQKKVEERNFDIRKHLLEYDDVMNQQRKSIYNLRRQVLEGRYKTVPTEDELEKGVQPVSLAPKGADPELRKLAEPMVANMVRVHSAELPPAEITPEEAEAYRQKVMEMDLSELGEVRVENLEQNVYKVFGCNLPLSQFKKDAKAAHDHLIEEVALSLTEQMERLWDLSDETIGTMVERACPPKKHWEDWDTDGLQKAYKEQFNLDTAGAERLTDPHEVAEKLYHDAEAVMKKKIEASTPIQFLRLFRNLYLEEIDKQWLEHLSHMDHLREGIGLRGYGGRDAKKEYKREGYDLFLQTTQSIKASVVEQIYRVRVLTEAEVQAAEALRRKHVEERQAAAQGRHPAQQQQQQGGAGPQQPSGPQRLSPAQLSAARAAVGAQRMRLTSAQAAAGPQPAGAAPRANGGPAPAPQGASRAQRRRAASRGQAVEAAAPQETVRRSTPKVKRNDPCHCGSGKKYKNCHMKQDQAAV